MQSNSSPIEHCLPACLFNGCSLGHPLARPWGIPPPEKGSSERTPFESKRGGGRTNPSHKWASARMGRMFSHLRSSGTAKCKRIRQTVSSVDFGGRERTMCKGHAQGYRGVTASQWRGERPREAEQRPNDSQLRCGARVEPQVRLSHGGATSRLYPTKSPLRVGFKKPPSTYPGTADALAPPRPQIPSNKTTHGRDVGRKPPPQLPSHHKGNAVPPHRARGDDHGGHVTPASANAARERGGNSYAT